MSENDILTFEEVRRKIEEHLRIALKIESFDITYARVVVDEWHVNIEWKKEENSYSQTALFALDARTGKVKTFQKDRYWTW